MDYEAIAAILRAHFPEPAKDARELAEEAYRYIEGKVFAWMRREDGSPDPDIKPQIIDWLGYKIEAHLAARGQDTESVAALLVARGYIQPDDEERVAHVLGEARGREEPR
jgi:hypothetical protein